MVTRIFYLLVMTSGASVGKFNTYYNPACYISGNKKKALYSLNDDVYMMTYYVLEGGGQKDLKIKECKGSLKKLGVIFTQGKLVKYLVSDNLLIVF